VIGVLAMLLEELAKENQISYSNHMRISTAKFEELLQMVGLKTQGESFQKISTHKDETGADTLTASQ
jgi:hypothetical protein